MAEVDMYSANAGSTLTANGLDTTIPIHVFGGTGFDSLVVDDRSMFNRQPNQFDLYSDHVTRHFASSPAFETLNYSGYESETLYMNTNEQTENVYSTPVLPAGQQITMYGTSNPDLFTAYPRDVAGNPTVLGNLGIIGNGGADVLMLSDTLSTTGTSWTVSNPFGANTQDFAVAGGALIGALNDIGVIYLLGSSGDDVINVNTYKSGSIFNILAGAGNDTCNFGNNSLINNITSLGGFTYDGQGGGSDTFNMNSDSDLTGTYTATNNSLSYVPSFGTYSIGLSILHTELTQLFPSSAQVNVTSVGAGNTTAVYAPSQGAGLAVGSAGLLSGILGSVFFDGGTTAANGSTISVNDSADTAGRIAHLTQNSLGAFPGDNLFPAGGSLSFTRIKAGFLAGLTLSLGSGADTVYAQPNPTGTIAISASNPTSAPGDVLNLALASAQNFALHGTSASGNVTSSNLKTLSYNGFEAGPTVDAVAPAALNGNINLDGVVAGKVASRRQAFDVQFSENLGLVSAVTLQLTDLTTGETVPTANIAVSFDPLTDTAHFTFPGYPGGILPDGNYHGVIVASQAADTFGNFMSANTPFDFFFLQGDVNHDRKVDATDLGILSLNWQQSARTFSQGDLNYDGVVDVNDLNILASRWHETLALPMSLRILPSSKQLPIPIATLIRPARA